MSKPLSQLRAKIDAIDDKLFALLKQRIGIVKQVGELKSRDRSNRCFIRSGREADMVRRVYGQFKDTDFSSSAAAVMWRQIIMASLNVESPLKISVFSPESDPTFYWLAREYFGNFTPLAREASTQRVVADVIEGRAHVGVLPMPYETQDDWWLQLTREGDMPRIFAAIPFVTTKAEFKKAGALAIAYVDPEKTTEDVSFYALRTDREISQSRLNAAFTKAGLEVAWRISAVHDGSQRAYFAEIKGFHPSDDAQMKSVANEAGASLQEMIYLGSYATPIFTD